MTRFAMFAIALVLLLGTSVPTTAQNRKNLTAGQVIYAGQTAGWVIGDWRRENTHRRQIEAAERVRKAEIDAYDRQNARWAQVRLGEVSAHTGQDISTSERTDERGNISLNSSVTNPAGRRGGGSTAGPLTR